MPATFDIQLPRTYPREIILGYLGRDPQSLTEQRQGNHWRGAFNLAGRPAVVTVELLPRIARCGVESSGRLTVAVEREAELKLKRRLGLHLDPKPFEKQVLADPALAPLVAGRRGLTIPQVAEPFEAVLWAIVGQQVNLTFARTLMRRLVELAGEPAGGGLSTVPSPEAVAALPREILLERQFSRAKVDYLLGVSATLARGEVSLEALAAGPADSAERTLLALRGLGPWAVNYLMMRGLGFADCVPWGDTGLATGLERFFGLTSRPSRGETQALMEPFRPYRSLATFHLWQVHGSSG